MFQKYRNIVIGITAGLFIGITQGGGSVPGVTDQAVSSEQFPMFLGIGIALGFFVGLANLSIANPNPHKLPTFLFFITVAIVALAINLHRGFIVSDFGFNLVSLINMAVIPSMLIGGYASSVFSKNA